VSNTVECVDALDWLCSLPDESVNTIITSPPYMGLRTYGVDGQIGLENTPAAYVARLVAVFCEARRVLRGDSYAANRSYQVTPTKWKALEFDGANATKVPPGLKPKDLMMIPARVALALQADGWYLRSPIPWIKLNPMPESVMDRPVMAIEYVYMLTKSAKCYFDYLAIRSAASESSLKRIEQSTFDTQQGGSKDYGLGTNPNRSARQTLENFAKNPGHSYRNSDGFLSSLIEAREELDQVLSEGGLLLDEDNDPLAIVTSLSPSDWDYCKACGRLYVGKERKAITTIGEGQDRKRFCLCGANEWVQHFAAYPPKLIEPFVKAGCPEKVCEKCGKPWMRVTEKLREHGLAEIGYTKTDNLEEQNGWKRIQRRVKAARAAGEDHNNPLGGRIDLGLQPVCSCEASTRPGIVLDMFAGSGTTGLVAQKLGRQYWLCDLNPDYVKVIEARLHYEQPKILELY